MGTNQAKTNKYKPGSIASLVWESVSNTYNPHALVTLCDEIEGREHGGDVREFMTIVSMNLATLEESSTMQDLFIRLDNDSEALMEEAEAFTHNRPVSIASVTLLAADVATSAILMLRKIMGGENHG